MAAAKRAAKGATPAYGAQRKLEWLEAVARAVDEPTASRVAIIYATVYFNGGSGEAWPAQATLAALLGLCEKTISRAVARLVADGFLARRPAQIGIATNRYRLAFPAAREADNPVCPDRTNLSGDPGQNCPPNPEKEPKERTLKARAGAATPFEAFETAWRWEAADSRKAARDTFERLDEEDRAEAVRCIPLYLVDCERVKRKQCFAKTYLNEGRWTGFAVTPENAPAALLVPIYKGTPQFEAWERHDGRKLPTKELQGLDGKSREGWLKPSAWPPGHSKAEPG